MSSSLPHVPLQTLLRSDPVQVLGFSVRLVCYWHTESIALYAVQGCLIVLAPVLYSASVYLALGRLISSTNGDEHSLIRPRRLSRLFIWSDWVALNLQGNGSGLAVSGTRTLALAGQIICIIGLVFQVVMLVLFLSTAAVFHSNMNKSDQRGAEGIYIALGEQQGTMQEARKLVPWRKGPHTLYACSVLIIMRSIFRAVEYGMGPEGYLLVTEWPMYALDTAFMLVCQAIFWYWLPSEFTYRELTVEDPEYKRQEWKKEKGWKKFMMAGRASLPW